MDFFDVRVGGITTDDASDSNRNLRVPDFLGTQELHGCGHLRAAAACTGGGTLLACGRSADAGGGDELVTNDAAVLGDNELLITSVLFFKVDLVPDVAGLDDALHLADMTVTQSGVRDATNVCRELIVLHGAHACSGTGGLTRDHAAIIWLARSRSARGDIRTGPVPQHLSIFRQEKFLLVAIVALEADFVSGLTVLRLPVNVVHLSALDVGIGDPFNSFGKVLVTDFSRSRRAARRGGRDWGVGVLDLDLAMLAVFLERDLVNGATIASFTVDIFDRIGTDLSADLILKVGRKLFEFNFFSIRRENQRAAQKHQ